MGTFRKELGSYERSLLGKILHLNISVGLCWVWRAEAYLRELWELLGKSWEVMSDRSGGKFYLKISGLTQINLGPTYVGPFWPSS